MVSLVTLYSHSLRMCSAPQSHWPMSILTPWGWALLCIKPFGHCPCSLLERASLCSEVNLFLVHPSLHLVWIPLVVITRTSKGEFRVTSWCHYLGQIDIYLYLPWRALARVSQQDNHVILCSPGTLNISSGLLCLWFCPLVFVHLLPFSSRINAPPSSYINSKLIF